MSTVHDRIELALKALLEDADAPNRRPVREAILAFNRGIRAAIQAIEADKANSYADAEDVAEEKIPEGVYVVEHVPGTKVFYGRSDKVRMSDEFAEKWRHRVDEFPIGTGWADSGETEIRQEQAERKDGPGTPSARLTYLLDELDRCFPWVTSRYDSKPADRAYIETVRGLQARVLTAEARLTSLGIGNNVPNYKPRTTTSSVRLDAIGLNAILKRWADLAVRNSGTASIDQKFNGSTWMVTYVIEWPPHMTVPDNFPTEIP
jgi:hypothetical protein